MSFNNYVHTHMFGPVLSFFPYQFGLHFLSYWVLTTAFSTSQCVFGMSQVFETVLRETHGVGGMKKMAISIGTLSCVSCHGPGGKLWLCVNELSRHSDKRTRPSEWVCVRLLVVSWMCPLGVCVCEWVAGEIGQGCCDSVNWRWYTGTYVQETSGEVYTIFGGRICKQGPLSGKSKRCLY